MIIKLLPPTIAIDPEIGTDGIPDESVIDIHALNASSASSIGGYPDDTEFPDDEFHLADDDEDDLPTVEPETPRIRERVIISTIPAEMCAELVVEWLFAQFSQKVQQRTSTAVRFFTIAWLEKVIQLLGGAVDERDQILSLIQARAAHRAGFFKHPTRPDVVGIAPFRELGSETTDKMFLSELPDADSKKVGFYVPGSQQRVLQVMADKAGVSVSDYLSSNVAVGVKLTELARKKGVTVEELLLNMQHIG